MKLEVKEPIAILGFGVEGQAALQFLKSEGIKDITICDNDTDLAVPDGLKSKLGIDAFKDLDEFNTIIRSPGVRYDGDCTSLTKMTMQVAGGRVTAITGSNGKTTTTALTQKILEAHYGNRLITGGNDRKPILVEAISREKDPILMEVSSFQYHDMHESPYIAAITNITPNHMDWHENFEEYVDAKRHLFCCQKKGDWAVINLSDENASKLGDSTKAQHFWIGQKRGPHNAIWEKGHLVLTFDGKSEILLHKDDLTVKTHPDNILIAAAIAKLHMVPNSTTIEQIKEFRGMPHRMEHIRTVNDIHFYNDSSSTTPESTEIAIDLFPIKKLILMLGGSSKKSDFSKLAKRIVDNEIRVYLYGKEGKVIKAAIEALGGEYLVLEYNTSGDFEAIIKDVFKKANPEDNIVFSPACASFDMFENAKQRGRLFTEAVQNL